MYGKIRFVEAGQLRRKSIDSVVAPRFFGGSQNGMWTLQSPFMSQVGRPDPPKHLGAFFRLCGSIGFCWGIQTLSGNFLVEVLGAESW